MDTKFRLLLIFLGGLLVLATFTYPMWRPSPAGDLTAQEDFPELTEEQQALFVELPLATQRAYLLIRQQNAAMATELLTARLEPSIALPPEEQEMPPVDGATVAARGEFGPVTPASDDDRDPPAFSGLHTAAGEVIIYQFPDNRKILRIEDLQVTNGPNLQLVLSTDPAPMFGEDLGRDRINLGPLLTTAGNQNYIDVVPTEININTYRSLVIYNSTYDILFAVAPLGP
jgi:hypothetical protein